MIVYVVTAGDYSDYRVCCVCSTEEKADEAARLFASDNTPMAYELDDFPRHPNGMFPYWVEMDAEGNTIGVRCVPVEGSEPPEWQPGYSHRWVIFRMWAVDEKHAVKIANERRAQLIAFGEWTTDRVEWLKRQQERKKR